MATEYELGRHPDKDLLHVRLARWPTPKASPSGPDFARMDREGSGGDDLATAVARQMWPTPVAGMADRGDRGDLNTAVKGYASPSGHTRMWPTPTANEDAAGQPGAGMQKMLGNHPDVRGSGNGTLNPTWVEWLMGFPLGWTDLGPSETRSSRRSSKSSAGGSSK